MKQTNFLQQEKVLGSLSVDSRFSCFLVSHLTSKAERRTKAPRKTYTRSTFARSYIAFGGGSVVEILAFK